MFDQLLENAILEGEAISTAVVGSGRSANATTPFGAIGAAISDSELIPVVTVWMDADKSKTWWSC